jgi:hypothetical protein
LLWQIRVTGHEPDFDENSEPIFLARQRYDPVDQVDRSSIERMPALFDELAAWVDDIDYVIQSNEGGFHGHLLGLVVARLGQRRAAKLALVCCTVFRGPKLKSEFSCTTKR